MSAAADADAAAKSRRSSWRPRCPWPPSPRAPAAQQRPQPGACVRVLFLLFCIQYSISWKIRGGVAIFDMLVYMDSPLVARGAPGGPRSAQVRPPARQVPARRRAQGNYCLSHVDTRSTLI